MGLAEDLKALQDLREKGELSENDYGRARDTMMRKHGIGAQGVVRIGRLTGFVLMPALVIVLAWLLLGESKYSQTRSDEATHHHLIPIANNTLAVGAGSLAWYQFSVPPNATNVQVDGHFTAAGGSTGEVIAFVVDANGLFNLKNERATRTFFDSKKVSQASLIAGLPDGLGVYYLAFDNRFSPDTAKSVQVNGILTYTSDDRD